MAPTFDEEFADYALHFIYLVGFEDDRADLQVTDDDLVELETAIMDGGKNAPIIRGSAGVRKMRFAPSRWNIGKSGATRVLFVYFEQYATVYMLGIYAKHVAGNVSAAALKEYREWVGSLEQLLSERYPPANPRRRKK